MERLDVEIHVYRLDLASCAEASAQCAWALLNAAERERAGRIQHAQTQRCFVQVRATLRSLLGQYLRCDPAGIGFTVGDKGKPRLAGTAPDAGLVFNVSHSGDCGLIAFARDTALGVDIERQRPMANRDGMAQRCFATGELVWWQSLTECEREQAFFRLWSCKEAFVKATGAGITLGLQSCAVDLSGLARLAALPAGYGLPDDWRLAEVDVGVGYAAAICHNGAPRKLRLVNGAEIVNNW